MTLRTISDPGTAASAKAVANIVSVAPGATLDGDTNVCAVIVCACALRTGIAARTPAARIVNIPMRNILIR